MNRDDLEEYLNSRGVKPTANRLLVAKELQNASRPLSLGDLEQSLDSMDKASIFRVLERLAEKEIVHVIEDGSRSVKYELCRADECHTITDRHVHFYCDKCKEIFCFETVKVPMIDIPEGFQPRDINYMVKGLCPKCRRHVEA